uniref:NAC domain-containing protein n=1 Tax=Leersia perrieri TaxID=77586 RepID=A0A0D9W688_9ORYZ
MARGFCGLMRFEGNLPLEGTKLLRDVVTGFLLVMVSLAASTEGFSFQIAPFRTWIIFGGEVIATKIRNATQLLSCKLGELVPEAWGECPNCKVPIDNSNVNLQWPELPAGVKFDPTDPEILEHLERKINMGNPGPPSLIDHFIPTIKEVEGICYTHPENLPGIKMDGSSSYFFHRISNAYGCGKRKRRKIRCNNHTADDENIRWHKTGRSKEIHENNGVKKGLKKILVLYKGSRQDKIEQANWVIHQYSLGLEDEKDGELVVSKVFYQLSSKQTCTPEMDSVTEEASDALTIKSDPITTITNPPQPRRPMNSPCDTEQNGTISHDQEEGECGTSILRPKVEPENLPGCSGTASTDEDSLKLEALLQWCSDLPGDPVAPLEEPLPFPGMDAFSAMSPDLGFSLALISDLQNFVYVGLRISTRVAVLQSISVSLHVDPAFCLSSRLGKDDPNSKPSPNSVVETSRKPFPSMAPPTSTAAAVAAAARAAPTSAAALSLFKSALSADAVLSPLAVLPHLTGGDAPSSLPSLLLAATAAARPHATSLRLYARIKSLSLPISAASLHPLLSALPSAPAFALFADMFRLRLPLCTTTFNIMLRHLCFSGKPSRALQLLRQMPRPNAVTYNTVIAGFCSRGRVQAAMDIMREMRERGGIAPNQYTYGTVISGWCKVGRVDEAAKVFDEMLTKGEVKPEAVMYNALIGGYCDQGKLDTAFLYCHKMLERGVAMTVATYNLLVHALFMDGRGTEAYELVEEMGGKGLAPDVFTYNILINGHCREGNVKKALEVFETMSRKGVRATGVTYTSLIYALSKKGQVQETDKLFDEAVKRGIRPDLVLYNALINSHSSSGDIDRAFEIMGEMEKKRIAPDDVTYNTLMRGLCLLGRVDEARKLIDDMTKRGIKPDLVTYNTLIRGYSMKGDVKDALRIRNEMMDKGFNPTLLTYNALIQGLCKNGQGDDAENMVKEMVENGITPDDSTYISLIEVLTTEDERAIEDEQLAPEDATKA